MSDIPPLAQAEPSPREDPEEYDRFQKAKAMPLEVLHTIDRGQPLNLTKAHRLEVAKLCAGTDAQITASKIHLFTLNEQERFEVARVCIKRDSSIIFNLIEFKLTEEHLFELTKLCMELEGPQTYFWLSSKLQLLGLSPAKHLEIITFHLFPEFMSQGDVFNRHLNDEQRLEVVEFSIEENIDFFLENMHLFNLTEKDAFEAAKLCAKKNAFATAENIEKFGLTGDHSFEVAQLCARESGESVINHIAKFALTEDQRFVIAELCAKEDDYSTIHNIHKFDLNSLQRLKIAKLCFQEDPSLILRNIDTFNLSEDLTVEFFLFASRQDPKKYAFFLEELVKILVKVAQKGDIPTSIDLLSRMGWVDAAEWGKLMKGLGPQEQKVLIARAVNAVAIFYKGNISEKEVNWISRQRFLAKILESRPSLDPVLAGLAKEMAKNRKHFENLKLTEKFPLLLCLPLAKLQNEGVDIDSLKLNPKDVKDTKKIVPFLQSMIKFADNNDLSPRKKTQIVLAMNERTIRVDREIENLRKEIVALQTGFEHLSEEVIFQRKKEIALKRAELEQSKKDARTATGYTLDAARDLSTILSCGGNKLLEKNVVRTTEDFKVLAFAAFVSILPLPAQVDDFSVRLQETFGSYRIPNALQTYAAKLSEDPSCQAALVCLGNHVFAVLKSTYKEERYDPTTNPHLGRLHEYDPNLLDIWKKHSEEPLAGFPGYTVHETDDPEDLLLCGTEISSCQSIDFDAAYNQGLVGYLRNGQTRLLEVKDKDGIIVARRLLRLLWDDNEERPVLFVENLYSRAYKPALEDALIKKAKQKADLLNCPLTSLHLPNEKYADYPNSIESLGGLAPCEYVDGVGGLREEDYTIYVVQVLYDPLGAAAAE